MKHFALVLMALASFSLGACESVNNAGQKETIGGVTGAVVGGLLGSKVGGGSGQLWATGAGVLLGTLVGSEIGKSLDKADMAYIKQTNQQAYEAPIGETINWNNPESGNYGQVTPKRDGYTAGGRYCREFEQIIYVDGVQETARGTACQNPDGTWEILG